MHNMYYQLPIMCINCIAALCLINVFYLTACAFIKSCLNDAESTQNQKLRHNRCKLINRIPGSRLLISSLPGSALRMHVESLFEPRDVNKRSQSLAW